jgi:hypothetical protein
MESAFALSATLTVLYKLLEFSSALEVVRKPLSHLELPISLSIFTLKELKREPGTRLKSRSRILGRNLTLTPHVSTLCTICSDSRVV